MADTSLAAPDGSAAPGDGGSPAPPSSSNQVAREFFHQNGYTKATNMMDQANAAGGEAAAGGSRGNAMDVDAESGADAGKTAGAGAPAGKPLVVEKGYKEAEFIKRNAPYALAASASTHAPYVTDEFIAQASEIVARQKKENAVGASLLDSSDRTRGYERLRVWIESGLEGWKPELRALLYPVFVHTFLDLIDSDRLPAAREFFANHQRSHQDLHSRELTTLSTVNMAAHILTNPLVKLFRTEKYTVNLSSASYGLYMGWLSDVGLEGLWETGRDVSSGRAKESVRNIVVSRLDIKVHTSARPLSHNEIMHDAGFLSLRATTDGFNTLRALRLGPPALSGRLKAIIAADLEEAGEEPLAAAPKKGTGSVDDPSEAGSSKPVEAKFLVPSMEPNALPTAMDVERELQAIRDARKRIRLGADGKAADLKGKVVLPSICSFTLYDQGEGTTSTAISQDSTLLAAGSAESCVRVWSLKGEMLRRKKVERREDELEVIEDPDEPGTAVRKLIGHSGPVYSVAFDPIGGAAAPPKHLLSASQDGGVRLWSLETWQNLVLYKGHVDPVWDVQWAPLGVHFATASRDRTARLWMTERTAPVRMYAGHLGDVECLRFHPNSLYLATGSTDRSCRLWDVHRGECVRVFLEHEDAVNCIAMSPDGRYMASAAEDHQIILWDIGSGRAIKHLTGHSSTIHALSFSADSAIITSAGADCTVRCWDVKGSGAGQANGTYDPYAMGGSKECPDLLATYRTKRTPMTTIQFTPRNLCLSAGTYQVSSADS